MVIWSEGKYNDQQLSDWYNNLSCYIFPSSGEGWSYTPHESMYLGIPTIVSDISLHEDLIRSGFCKAIKTAGIEPANFNGRIHGNWANVDDDEIEKAILDVYSNYTHFQDIAAKGAEWISKKWPNEEVRQELLKFLKQLASNSPVSFKTGS